MGAECKVIIFSSNCVFLAIYVFIYSFQLREKNKSQILIPGQVICGVFQRIIGERQRAMEESETPKQRDRKMSKRERTNRNLRRCESLLWLLLENLEPGELNVPGMCMRQTPHSLLADLDPPSYPCGECELPWEIKVYTRNLTLMVKYSQRSNRLNATLFFLSSSTS